MVDTVARALLRQGEEGPVLSGNAGDVLAFGADGRTVQGVPPSGGIVPIAWQFWVDPSRADDGDGSVANPFNKLASAIAAAAPLPQCTQIFLAPADYTSEGPISYTDKRLTIEGFSLFNQSGTTTPTHGVTLRPTSSDDSNLVLEITRTNCNIIPQSQGIQGFFFQAYAEVVSDNVHFGTYRFEGSPDTMRAGSEGTVTSSIYGEGVGLAETICAGEMFLNGSEVNGVLTLTNMGTPRSVFRDTLIKFSVSASHPLELWGCTFPVDGSGIVISGGAVTTDLATYARGLTAGVTWPANVVIVDESVTLQPFWVAAGVGSNSVGSPTPALGTNVAGDLFVCHVNAIGAQVPTMPAGWTKQAEKIQGAVIEQVWTRDARSAGGEVGTVTVTVGGGGNTPTEAIIHTFRRVATAAFVESIVTAGAASNTPAGPTVVAGGAGRLACCFTGANGTVPPNQTAIAGNAGGTWVVRDQFDSGLGGNMGLQTAALATSGTVTGGAMTVSGTMYAQIAFALVGAVA